MDRHDAEATKRADEGSSGGPIRPGRPSSPEWLGILSLLFGVLAVDLSSGAQVAPVQQLLPPGAVSDVGGLLGERLRGNARHLLAFDAERYVAMFEEKTYRDWTPVGEQLGKWLEAAFDASTHAGNAPLRKKAEDVLARLLAAQEKSGYLGITDPKLRSERQPLRAMEAYELTFTLGALLTAHERGGHEGALAAARRLADFLIATIGPGKAEFWPVPNDVTIAGESAYYGLQGTLLASPMARLHRLCGEREYLDWSQWVVGSIDRWSGHGTLSNLDEVAAGRRRLHQIQPNLHAHTLHLNLLALLELHQATGDRAALSRARGAWSDIVDCRLYVTGGVGVGERYQGEFHLPNAGAVADTCALASWLALNQRLLELTGEPEFADTIERLLWNHLPAAATAEADGWRHYTPLSGWKPEGCFAGPDCCSSSGPRLLAAVPTLLCARTADGIAINQYVASSARVTLPSGNEVVVRQVTDYPAGENVAVEVAPARPERFTLRLRIPSWCEKPAVTVNGERLARELERGAYAVIEREWRKGDRVGLTLPMEPRWVAGTHGNAGLCCLQRGPLVYALDTIWCDGATRKALVGDAKGDPVPGLGGVVLDPDEPGAGLEAVPTPDGALGPAYRVRIALTDGKRALATMLPFANVGVWYRTEAERRDPKARRDAYAVWLGEARSRQFRTVDLRRVVNVHASSGRGLFTSPAHAAEAFPFARTGRVALDGIPFEILDPARNGGRSLLILRGGPAQSLASRYPAHATIPAGLRCRALHFLGGVGGWAFPSNGDRGPALTVRIRYDDAPTQEVRWNNGEHLADYSGRHDVPGSAHALDVGGRQLRLLRIRTSSTSKVTRIELIDSGSAVAPVVAAVTAELPEE